MSDQPAVAPIAAPLPTPDRSGHAGVRAKMQRWLSSTVLFCAGYDNAELLPFCSPSELNGAKVRGILLLSNIATTAGLLIAGAHYLLNSSFSWEITLAASLIAAFLGLLDHYVLLRAAVLADGERLLKKAGLKASVSLGSGTAAKICKAIRVAMSVGTGCLGAFVMGMMLNHAAIDSRIDAIYVARNRPIVDHVVTDASDDRVRLATEYQTLQHLARELSTDVEKLSASEARLTLKSAGHPSRALDQLRADLADHTAKLDAANKSLAELKASIAAADAARPAAEHDLIEHTPGHIARDDSFNARGAALFSEVRENPFAALPAALLDSLIVGLDVAILTLKAIPAESIFGAILARNSMRALADQARLAAEEIEAARRPRRGRGRPRKDDLGSSEEETDQ